MNIDELTDAFCVVIQEWLTDDELATVIERNRAETDKTVCHTHDFMDANEAMAEAWSRIGVELDLDDEAHCAAWNEAWSRACAREFALAGAMRG